MEQIALQRATSGAQRSPATGGGFGDIFSDPVNPRSVRLQPRQHLHYQGPNSHILQSKG